MEKTKMSLWKKLVIALIIILVIMTGAAYGYGVRYFTDHFLPGSKVNGYNCSYMTAKEAEKLLSDEVAAYVLAVETRNNGKESITAKEAGLVYVPDGGAKKLIQKQDRYKWFLAFNQKKNYRLAEDTDYDNVETLRKTVKNLKCMQKKNSKKPEDAYIDEEGETYRIVPEKEGTTLDLNRTIKTIRKAVSNGAKTVNLDKKGCYKKPSVYRDDEVLVKQCEELNTITSAVITYDFSDRSEQIDRSVLKGWLIQDEKGNYTIDRNQVSAYVNELCSKYNTVGTNRTFITYDGREKTITGGDYGWTIDAETETESLYNAILAGTTEVRTPAYTTEGKCRDTNDIGNTYVEIDITSQRMVFYKDGLLLVDTPVVTGCVSKGYSTPGGCYSLKSKTSPAVLRGPGYASPVTFWMPFNGGIGIHDASWRSQYGGAIYLTSGSHGCVNTPYTNAQTIYNNIEVGTPIVVYQ